MNYVNFLKELDQCLEKYFQEHKEYLYCREKCSACCEKGDYPLSQIELEYLMQGYITLPSKSKIIIQNNIKNMEKGGKCPFLFEKKCLLYKYRPIICRVHGLAYLCKDNLVKVPFCVHDGKNYNSVYKNGEITINPIKKNLDTPNLLKEFDNIIIKNLYDYLKQ